MRIDALLAAALPRKPLGIKTRSDVVVLKIKKRPLPELHLSIQNVRAALIHFKDGLLLANMLLPVRIQWRPLEMRATREEVDAAPCQFLRRKWNAFKHLFGLSGGFRRFFHAERDGLACAVLKRGQ